MDNTKETPVKRESSGGGVLGKPAEWWSRGREFLSDVRAELRRVTWPSRKEVYATTIVVIITSVIFGTYLWGLDLILAQAVAWLFRSLGAGAA